MLRGLLTNDAGNTSFMWTPKGSERQKTAECSIQLLYKPQKDRSNTGGADEFRENSG